MKSEYDPLGRTGDDPLAVDDLERARELFEGAGRPYLSQAGSWLAWAAILPGAALGTPATLGRFGGLGVLLLWSLAVIVGGGIEAAQILRSRRSAAAATSTLASWVLRIQGNLSLVAVLLSVALIWQGAAWLLPGLWLLLLGHSFYAVGGLAAPALRTSGLMYQAGGILAVWPHGHALAIFAATTAIANLWVAVAIARRKPPTG